MAEKNTRWGVINPVNRDISNYPATWASRQFGVLIDWSGVTAVLVCLDPDCKEPQFGPIFDIDDVTSICAHHRESYHRTASFKEEPVVAVPQAAIDAARAITECWSCGRTPKRFHARGACPTCHNRLRLKHAIELGYLPEDANGGDLERLLAANVKAPRKPAQKPKKEVKPPKERRVLEGGKHGVYWKYCKGCRCEPCSTAAAAYSKAYRARQKAAS